MHLPRQTNMDITLPLRGTPGTPVLVVLVVLQVDSGLAMIYKAVEV